MRFSFSRERVLISISLLHAVLGRPASLQRAKFVAVLPSGFPKELELVQGVRGSGGLDFLSAFSGPPMRRYDRAIVMRCVAMKAREGSGRHLISGAVFHMFSPTSS